MQNELKRPELLRQYYKDLECLGPGKYFGEEYNYKGKPYTGFVIYDYWENGNVMNECEHVDGQIMGWDVEYYENGDLKRESLMWGGPLLFIGNLMKTEI